MESKSLKFLFLNLYLLCRSGNLCDAVSLAVKAALASTRLPLVRVTAVDGGEPEIEVDDDPGAFGRLDVTGAPLLVTLSRIGNHCIVDSSPEEESCSSASLVVAVTPDGAISTLRKVTLSDFDFGDAILNTNNPTKKLR